mgnify:CR=1 FL=1
MTSRLNAGNGIEGIEGRIAAIETRIRHLQQMTGAAHCKTPFAAYLEETGAISAPAGTPAGTMTRRAAAFQPGQELAHRGDALGRRHVLLGHAGLGFQPGEIQQLHEGLLPNCAPERLPASSFETGLRPSSG